MLTHPAFKLLLSCSVVVVFISTHFFQQSIECIDSLSVVTAFFSNAYAPDLNNKGETLSLSTRCSALHIFLIEDH